jgi:hypothetical protein
MLGILFTIAVIAGWFGTCYYFGYLLAKMDSDRRKFLDDFYDQQ